MEEIDDVNPFAEEPLPPSREHTGEDDTNGDTSDMQPGPPPLPTKHSFPSPGPAHLAFQNKTDFCCSRDRWLHSGDGEIQITEAHKTSDGSNASYIAYAIRSGTAEARRRYSEFESLRSSLVKLYPTLIIPPIPSKTSIGDYAVKQSKAKEDVSMISRRKRLLQSFLNRVARHPILSHEHVFHRFLQSDVSWSEVLNSPPISMLPKNLLKAPSHSPTDNTAPQIYSILPSPSASQSLRKPDQRFLDSEAFTDKFASHVSGPMEKVTRRTMKRWTDIAQDNAELGAALNGFSLNEEGTLAVALEKFGQAVDTTYLSTSMLLQEMEAQWAEPLHEYSQFAEIIRRLLTYRHQKHAQYELTESTIEIKKDQLADLEKVEAEARRLDSALSNGRVRPIPGPSQQNRASRDEPALERVESDDGAGGTVTTPTGSDAQSKDEERTETDYGDLPSYTAPAPPPVKRRAPGMGLLNALSYTLHGMMDVDPETGRRNNITKTREIVSQLEDALQASAQDLKYAGSTIQADLDRFQRQKVSDLRDMAIALAKSHRDMLKKNLDAWLEVQKEVANIDAHPNDAAAGELAKPSKTGGPSPLLMR